MHCYPPTLTLLLLAPELLLQVSVGGPGASQSLLSLPPQIAGGGVLVELPLHQHLLPGQLLLYAVQLHAERLALGLLALERLLLRTEGEWRVD